ncbi:MAG: HAD-IA family hydrolase [Pseudomonadales bacterium]|nr:HAD-IA family hydrolase [Pseudomonadales bacterium]
MSKRSVVIFDWDGTLMDSTAKIVASMQAAGVECGLGALGFQEIENIIGLGLPEAILVLYPDALSSERESLRLSYSHHYVNVCTVSTPLFHGVTALLDGLVEADFQLAIATGKSRQGLNRVLKQSGLSSYFVTSRCADETESKPHPKMLFEILDELALCPESALMIGDTEYDLEMASLASISSIGVTYGAHSLERLERHGPIFCVDEPIRLLDQIKLLA